MDLNNRIEGADDRAELRRREMRVERRREPLIGTSEPLLDDREHVLDAEESIRQNRIVSRFLIMLGVFFLIFAGFWWIYTGWEVRNGREFTISLMLISAAVGLILIIAGAIKRSRHPMVRRARRESREERAA
jgi:hypothetical protein